MAEGFSIAEGTLASLLDDLGTASVDERLKPVLRYVGKLTRTPTRIAAEDAQAVLDAGWDERALHDAVAVCALFNFMNRYVDGLGVTTRPDLAAVSSGRLRDIGYAGLRDLL